VLGQLGARVKVFPRRGFGDTRLLSMSRARTTTQPPPDSGEPRKPGAHVPRLYEEEGELSHTDQTGFAPISTRTAARPRLTVLTGQRAGFVTAVENELIIGRASDAHLRLLDAGVSRRHARILRTAKKRFVLEDLGSTNGTFLNGSRIRRSDVHAGDRIQIGPEVALQFAMLDEAEERLAQRLYEASTRDPLTGALNRKAFGERLEAEVAYGLRHKSPVTVIMIDVDHFKTVNDNFGHPAGDAVLRAIALHLARAIRIEDALCRYGGEEFALLTRGISLRQATKLAERLRRGIEASRIIFGSHTIKVTVSIGVAELREVEGTGLPSVVELADVRLYAAKQGGRNLVVARS
jgi:diguanylate cyclase (GGDEF)-like protein